MKGVNPRLLTTPAVHVVIPDTQVKPGIPTDHLSWIGQYLVDQFAGSPNVKVIHLGDHWDMPSLSSYDRKGGKAMEGRRIYDDLEAGNAGFDRLNAPLWLYNEERKARRLKPWAPERHFLLGNHEDRISRLVEADVTYEGMIGLDFLNPELWDWTVHDFLEPVMLDGVIYSHYLYNPMSGRPYSGQGMDARLKTVGHSFTMGHQQGLLWARRETVAGPMIGLVAGSCYLHDEDYKGPQANDHWRGIVICHQVENGAYDPMFVSLDYLCRRYEGMTLKAFHTRGL